MNTNLINILKNNGIVVLATDTLYGIVGNAHSQTIVERIYTIKGRDENKPFIILIPSIAALDSFGITLTEKDRQFLETVWPGAVTVILPIVPSHYGQLAYLHRGTNELAFRLPNKASLRSLLEQVGPLVAPSANPQSFEPAYTIAQAQEYFGTTIDHYEDEGEVRGEPSTIVRLKDGAPTIVRQGAVSLNLDK